MEEGFESMYSSFKKKDYYDVLSLYDSLESTLYEADYERYKGELSFFKAYMYKNDLEFEAAFDHYANALEVFLYNEQEEWVARTLLDMTYICVHVNDILSWIKLSSTALSYTSDSLLIGRLKISRAQAFNEIGRPFLDDFSAGVALIEKYGDKSDVLYINSLGYWMFRDSSELVQETLSFAYECLDKGSINEFQNAYFAVIKYYTDSEEYDSTLYLVHKYWDYIENFPEVPDYRKSKAVYYQAKAFYGKGYYDEAEPLMYSLLKKDNSKNAFLHYFIYKDLTDVAVLQGNYELALKLMGEMHKEYNAWQSVRFRFSYKVSTIFNRIAVIEQETEYAKRSTRNKMLFVIVVLLCIFTGVILWLRQRKLHFEMVSELVKAKNKLLKAETGKLLKDAEKEKISERLSEGHKKYQSSVRDYLMSNDDVPLEILNKYPDMLVVFDDKLPELTKSERRYAAMFALGVPSKAIVQIFKVQPGSVSQYRNRIRRKIGISNTDIDLKEKLNSYV